MSRRNLLVLYLAQLILLLGVSLLQHDPGYMDASYYYGGALRIVDGHGLSDAIVWHYLDDPTGLPHPSHGYWMPLTSLVAAIGLRLFFFLPPFEAAQLLLSLLAAGIAPLTASLAYQLTKRRDQAWLAGGLAVFSGFYLPYLPTSDMFALNMLLGGAFLWLLLRRPRGWALMLGLAAGLLYLARADGMVWLALGGIALVSHSDDEQPQQQRWACLAWFLGGFALLAAPWMLRNQFAFGSPLAPGGSRALWLLAYDELFFYPADVLTMPRWLAVGWPVWSMNWAFALMANLQTWVAVQGGVVLFPALLLGAWQLRRQRVAQLGLLGWLMYFVAMTLVFPVIGSRGGFFHAGAALMPLFWALTAVGLAWLAERAAGLPGWSPAGAWRLVRVVSLLVALLLSGAIVWQQVLAQPWDAQAAQFRAVEAALQAIDAPADAVLMANNVPSLFATTGRPGVQLTGGDLTMLFAAADAFEVDYLVLDADMPAALAAQLDAGAVDRLALLWQQGDLRLYRIEAEPGDG